MRDRPFPVAVIVLIAGWLGLLLSACDASPMPGPQPTRTLTFPELYTDVTSRDLKMISVIPRDSIRAVLDPPHLSAGQAGDQFSADEMVIGVSIGEEHRAYSIPQLSRHEIVNDVLGGTPIAVTW